MSILKNEAIQRLITELKKGNLCIKKEEISPHDDLVSSGNDLIPKTPIVLHQGYYYLQKNWVLETYILQEINRLRTSTPTIVDQKIFEEKLAGFTSLTSSQKKAIQSVLNSQITVITGGPGTGKTFTAAHIVDLLFSSFSKGDFHVALAAPTGKAANHLQTAITKTHPQLHITATTLHKLLKLQPGKSRLFEKRRIDADLIIVDEASMIDLELLAHLLESVRAETLLILIGDPNQLPPVEASSLFSELGKAFGISLEKCMRTDNAYLLELAQIVIDANPEEFFQKAPPQPLSSVETLYRRICPILSDHPPDPKECFETYSRFRILNPIRKSTLGTDALNAQILSMMKKTNKWWAAPILAISNDSFSEIYNGMAGILIGKGQTILKAHFPTKEFSQPPAYELAFCMSIHKAQGSEFDEILALFPPTSENFGREALYTAITRAKKRIEIQGDKATLEKMLQSSTAVQSGFLRRIKP